MIKKGYQKGWGKWLVMGWAILMVLGLVYMNWPVGYAVGVEFNLDRGESLQSVSDRLEGEGLVRFGGLSYIYGWIRLKLGGYLHWGDYKLEEEGLTTLEVVDLLFAGKGKAKELVLTIPEGYNLYDIGRLLKMKGVIGEESEFMEKARDRGYLKLYGIMEESLEGYIYPTTYFILKEEGLDRIIGRMVKTFRARFPGEEYESVKGKIKLSKYEVMILASLVEKETALKEEKGIVASVFYNRLRKNMRLECDPTVIYGLLREDRYMGNLSRVRGDLSIKSKYNSYIHFGLPPTPIANVSRETMMAVLYPEETDYYYFVSKKNKSHLFGRTFEEHRGNVRKYKEWHESQKKLKKSQLKKSQLKKSQKKLFEKKELKKEL